MKFEWDPKKAEINLRKHGVSFEEAMTVFKDTLALIFDDDEHSQDEHREIIIGTLVLTRIVLVCFVERNGRPHPVNGGWPATLPSILKQ
ncbi:MAG TPA: BrnT family toxin [Anaerolineales bacterium]|nr:BrnT family toxin [Anaerolineales bacterium]